MEYYESETYGKICETVFGLDLKQQGMMTKTELDLLLEKSIFEKSHNILEIGCGAGQISAYINEHFSAKFTCIDISEKVILWASNFYKHNKNLKFLTYDVKNILKIDEKFDKILAIDSLYFVSDMCIDTFLGSLETTLFNLYSMLKANGELIIFYSELPFFKPEIKSPQYTQLGICLNKLGYTYDSFDLTSGENVFWNKFKDVLFLYKEDFINENSEDLFNNNIKEAEFMAERAKAGLLYRNMYIIKKSE